MHQAKERALHKKTLAFFESCDFENGWPKFSSISPAVENLNLEIQKDYKNYLDYFQVLDILIEKLQTLMLKYDLKSKSGRLIDFINMPELEVSSQEIVHFIETIPRPYYFFFKMVQFTDTPYNISNITKDIDLVRVHFSTNTREVYEQIIKKRAGIKESEEIGPGFYLRVSIKGYCNGKESPTVEEAMSKFKQYIVSGILSGKFELSSNYSPWLENAEPKLHFVDVNNPSDSGLIKISESFSNLLKRIKLKEELTKKALEPEPVNKKSIGLGFIGLGLGGPTNPYPLWNQSTRILESNDENKNTSSIKNALEWAFDSLVNDSDQTLSFMQICIALEAILGTDTPKTGVTERLGDRCAYLIGRNFTERAKIRTEFDKFYEVRSKLIHGRNKKLKSDEGKWLYWGRNILYRVINKEILSAKDLDAVEFHQLK